MKAKKKTALILCASCVRPMELVRVVDYDCMAEKPCCTYAYECTSCLMRSPQVTGGTHGWSDRKAKRAAAFLAQRLYNLALTGATARLRGYVWPIEKKRGGTIVEGKVMFRSTPSGWTGIKDGQR
jgi:hypothetical protein